MSKVVLRRFTVTIRLVARTPLCAGTAELPELVENLRFTSEDIEYLASLQAPAGGADV